MARGRRPADGLDDDVALVCSSVLGFSVAPGDDLWELGLDSFAAVDVAVGCSELGWGTLDPTEMAAAATPAAIADVLRELARASFRPRSSQVVALTATGDRPPIVAFPGAGSTALAFRWLAQALGPDQPFLVVEAHGMHTPGDPDRTLAAQVDRAIATLASEVAPGPLTLLGHSAGGALAHEVGVRLAARGQAPTVILLDAVLTTAGPRRSAWQRARSFVAGTGERFRRARRVRRPGPPSPDPARFAAFETIGVRALAGHRPTPATLAEWHFCIAGAGATNGWPEGQRVVEVGGDHRSMLIPPHVEDLARRIAAVPVGAGR